MKQSPADQCKCINHETFINKLKALSIFMTLIHFTTLFYAIIPQIHNVGKGTVRIVQMAKS